MAALAATAFRANNQNSVFLAGTTETVLHLYHETMRFEFKETEAEENAPLLESYLLDLLMTRRFRLLTAAFSFFKVSDRLMLLVIFLIGLYKQNFSNMVTDRLGIIIVMGMEIIYDLIDDLMLLRAMFVIKVPIIAVFYILYFVVAEGSDIFSALFCS